MLRKPLVRSSTGGVYFPSSTLKIVQVKRLKVSDKDGLFGLLGVTTDADEQEIKSKGRRKLKQCHPDMGGDPEEFIMVLRAYETLTDATLRNEYVNLQGITIKRVVSCEKGPEPRSAYLKEPDLIMRHGDEMYIDSWIDMLLIAARDLALEISVVAAVRGMSRDYLYEDGVFAIRHGKSPEMGMARVMMFLMYKNLM